MRCFSLNRLVNKSFRISPTSRDYFPGEQFHRAPDRRVVDQPSLIEVSNELFHREILPESIDSIHAVIRVAEDADASVDTLVGHMLHSLLQLLVGFITSDWISG